MPEIFKHESNILSVLDKDYEVREFDGGSNNHLEVAHSRDDLQKSDFVTVEEVESGYSVFEVHGSEYVLSLRDEVKKYLKENL